jgi:Glycosyl hydrolase family 20, catalytic domain
MPDYPRAKGRKRKKLIAVFLALVLLALLLFAQLVNHAIISNDGQENKITNDIRSVVKLKSTRMFFDTVGNRITERLYNSPYGNIINKTIVESEKDFMQKNLRKMSSNDLYKDFRIQKQSGEINDVIMDLPQRQDHLVILDQTIISEIHRRPIKNDQMISASWKDPLMEPIEINRKLSLKLNVEYLGVLLDAGRHYFPIEWIYRLLDYLELMGFNLLHFRLTDDQAFNIRLDSHPELAQPASGSDGKVYTPNELRKLVAYAKEKGIAIMPELNVPGHAGGWAGAVPRLVVPCAGFICSKGYGLALNVSHPSLIPILRDVLIELKSIFSTTPFYHLGGDELEMSLECFQEININIFNYTVFEERLGLILKEIGIEHDQIVRWEMTGQLSSEMETYRVKGINHYWHSRGYQDNVIKSNIRPKVFCSHGLYFDTNQEEDSWTIYQNTRSMKVNDYEPIAIIAGTFELGVDYWHKRNVIGRLLAVALGSSDEEYIDEMTFVDRYLHLCSMLNLPKEMCNRTGAPMIPYAEFRDDWKLTTSTWRDNLCSRLAVKEVVPSLDTSPGFLHRNLKQANSFFWESFFKLQVNDNTKASERQTISSPKYYLHQILKKNVRHTGIILDLVLDDSFTPEKFLRVISILDYLHELGFNMLQLKIMNDYGFSIAFEAYHKLHFGSNHLSFVPWSTVTIKKIVDYATNLGIKVVPEITLAHRAGGWYYAAPMIPCPVHHCIRGNGLTLDLTKNAVLPIIFSIVYQLREIFSSEFIHLGFDERRESIECQDEANMHLNFDEFESKMRRIMSFNGISEENILRWENEEQTLYANRLGNITHYRKGYPIVNESHHKFFISTDLNLDEGKIKFPTAWDLYKQVQNCIYLKPFGVLATLPTLNDEILKSLNVRQRLLAIAIGLSVDNLAESEFKAIFLKLCVQAQNQNCEEYGKIRDFEVVAKLESMQLMTKERTCINRLRNVTKARPREGILVERWENVQKMTVVIENEI